MKLGKIDLSQIECRLLNTVARQWDIVEKFRNGTDIYSELATQFYGFPVSKSMPSERGTGKQLELSCGYGAGAATIVRTARAGTYGPPVYLSDEQGLAARDLYRRTHPAVVRLWDTGSRMLWHIHDGTHIGWGPLTVHDHRIFGPGGLWLDFTSLERFTPEGEKDEVWRHRVKTGWRKTYGARLVENVIQFLARIVISQAMIRIRAHGIRIALTCHDDVYIAVNHEKQFEIANAEMSRQLEWLPECPIAIEAKLGEDL